jgi:hypothetical protein
LLSRTYCWWIACPSFVRETIYSPTQIAKNVAILDVLVVKFTDTADMLAHKRVLDFTSA